MLEIEIVRGLKDSEIKQIMLDHGYTIKDGHDDLKPYVYHAAYHIEVATMKKWRDIVRRQNRLIDSLTDQLERLKQSPNAELSGKPPEE